MTGIGTCQSPGRRVYTKKQDIPRVLSGIGVAIISTPKGIMTGRVPASWAWRRDPLQGLVEEESKSVSSWTYARGHPDRCAGGY